MNIVNNWYQEDMQNDHLNVSNWNIKEIGDEWEAINIVSVYDMSVIYLTREISGCELQWERLKLLLCASKQLCGLELIAWRLCIMYQAGSFFLDFFFWKFDENKEKGIACVASQSREKEAQNQQQQQNLSDYFKWVSLYVRRHISDDHWIETL